MEFLAQSLILIVIFLIVAGVAGVILLIVKSMRKRSGKDSETEVTEDEASD